MNTTEYLAAAKRKTGAKNSAALAKALGLTGAALSRYESGDRVMDDYTAAKIAEILDIDPMVIIAQANAEREKDDGKRAYWQKIAARSTMHVALAVVAVVVLLLTGEGETSYKSGLLIAGFIQNTNYSGFG